MTNVDVFARSEVGLSHDLSVASGQRWYCNICIRHKTKIGVATKMIGMERANHCLALFPPTVSPVLRHWIGLRS